MTVSDAAGLDAADFDTGDQPIFAVLGATGRQGGAVAQALLDRGVRVRALTRQPDSDAGQALRDAGADVVAADLDDPASLARAFTGVAGIFAVTTPAVVGPDGETRQGIALADAAADAGVPHVVYSSVGGAERSTGIPHFESKRRVEEYLSALELRATIVRPVTFMTNFVDFLPPQVEGDELVLRAPLKPEIPLQLIAPFDIGEVAAVALLDPDSVPGDAIEIAGDELTGEQIAAVFGEVTGQLARFEPIPLESLADNADQQMMYSWFSVLPAYQADFGRTRLLDPGVLDFETFLRAERGELPAGPPDDRDIAVEANVAEQPRDY